MTDSAGINLNPDGPLFHEDFIERSMFFKLIDIFFILQLLFLCLVERNDHLSVVLDDVKDRAMSLHHLLMMAPAL